MSYLTSSHVLFDLSVLVSCKPVNKLAMLLTTRPHKTREAKFGVSGFPPLGRNSRCREENALKLFKSKSPRCLPQFLVLAGKHGTTRFISVVLCVLYWVSLTIHLHSLARDNLGRKVVNRPCKQLVQNPNSSRQRSICVAVIKHAHDLPEGQLANWAGVEQIFTEFVLVSSRGIGTLLHSRWSPLKNLTPCIVHRGITTGLSPAFRTTSLPLSMSLTRPSRTSRTRRDICACWLYA
jgi:hypothetical protein